MSLELSKAERDELVELIRAGRPLPARYRASLFEDAPAAELIWPGKTTEVERTVLPFQSIEHIDEPRTEVVTQPDLFSIDEHSGRQAGGWTNKLIWGDNKLILSSLANGPLRQEVEEAGGLKFVYIDPPFDVGADFSVDVEFGNDTATRSPSVVEEIAYRDTWGRARDSYLAMIDQRIRLIYSLLAPDGVLAVHLDWRLTHHVRCLLDEVFGSERFVNEIVWHYDYGARGKSQFGRKHDNISVYSMGDIWTFNHDAVLVPYESGMTEWRYTRGGQAGKEMPRGKVPSDVWDIKLNAMSSEHLGYPTQKPEALIERLISAFTNPGDLVADVFVGSGTTASVAEKLGRKWIAADLGRFSIHTSRKRLIEVQRARRMAGEPYRAFEILNLGSYERQYFAGADASAPEVRALDAALRREQFVSLVLAAYGAEGVDNLPPFHGVRGQVAIFVGPLDAPVTQDDVQRVVDTARSAGLRRVDVLGFEFEMGIKPAMADAAKEQGVTLSLRYIPNDVFDSRAVTKGQVRFYDVGYVEVSPKISNGRRVTVTLTDFGVFYVQDDADAAAAGLKAGGSRVVIDGGQVMRVSKDATGIIAKEALTKSWTDWIDYWAVDFNFESQRELVSVKEDATTKQVWTGRYIFENQWQSFRTRKNRELELSSIPFTYDEAGIYRIAVKVIDVFGNDTTKVIPVRVP